MLLLGKSARMQVIWLPWDEHAGADLVPHKGEPVGPSRLAESSEGRDQGLGELSLGCLPV